MDLVATKIRQAFKDWATSNGNKCKDQSNILTYLNNPDTVHSFESGDKSFEIYRKGIELTSKDFAKFPGTRHLTSTELKKTLNMITNYRFTGSYRIMTLKDEKYNFQHRVELTNAKLCSIDNFQIKFDTVLGSLFIHNIFSGAVTKLPDYIFDQFFNLSKYPTFLFRKYLLHLNHLIFITLDLDDVKIQLGLKTPGWRKEFKEWIQILSASKLLTYRRFEEGFGTVWCQVRRCNPTEIKELKKNYELHEFESAMMELEPERFNKMRAKQIAQGEI